MRSDGYRNWDTGAVEGVVGSIGCRVLVIGMAGAGKSTFSRALSARTGLPVIHLDIHYWKPGWVKPSEDEWREKQRGLLAGRTWIADGNDLETLDLRLERAETVVFLTHAGGFAQAEHSCAGFESRSAKCPKVATIPQHGGCRTSGG